MKQNGVTISKSIKNLILRVFRHISTFCVILFLSCPGVAQAKALDLGKAIKGGEYQAVIDNLKAVKRKLTVKERMFQALAFGKMQKVDQKIEVLKEASKQHPKVDLFKRELSLAIESKADSYADTRNYIKIKAALQAEAAKTLFELYSSKPTPANFTALLKYYNRQNLYEETVSLLEIYARKKDKGKLFYTYMCEAQFKATFYSGALKSCSKLVEIRPKYAEGHIYLSKTMLGLGEKELADKQIVKLAKRFPASAPVQYEAGRVLIERGESSKGLAHLERHINVKPSDEALLLKAETQFKQGAEADALLTFVQACKQYKEPRRPLLEKMKTVYRKMASTNELKQKYSLELSRCRYSYRPKKEVPKGILGGSYKSKAQ